MGSDLRPSIDAVLDAFGVAAVVTRPSPDNDPITTTGVWLAPRDESQPFGTDLKRQAPRGLMVLPRTNLPTMKRGAVIVAPEERGGPNKNWRVEGLMDGQLDEWRVIVVEIP